MQLALYKPLPGPYHFARKRGDAPGTYHVWLVKGSKPICWLGVILRDGAGWVAPRCGLTTPKSSRVAAADWLRAMRTAT